MRKPLSYLGATALALVLALPVRAETDADMVVATVNGEEITLGHVLMVRASLPEQYQSLPTDVLWQGIIDQLVQQLVLSQDDQARETRRVRVALENEQRSLLASEVIGTVAEAALTPEALQKAYQAQYVEAAPAQEFNASHILVETEEAAQALVDELAGGADFAQLAREHSTGPSGPNGGSLGWFGPGMMVAPFQDAVEGMQVGAVSDPVQTQFGWHVIKLNETRAQEAPTFEQVRPELEAELQRKAVEDYISAAVAGAEVTKTAAGEIDTAILNDLDLLEN